MSMTAGARERGRDARLENTYGVGGGRWPRRPWAVERVQGKMQRASEDGEGDGRAAVDRRGPGRGMGHSLRWGWAQRGGETRGGRAGREERKNRHQRRGTLTHEARQGGFLVRSIRVWRKRGAWHKQCERRGFGGGANAWLQATDPHRSPQHG